MRIIRYGNDTFPINRAKIFLDPNMREEVKHEIYEAFDKEDIFVIDPSSPHKETNKVNDENYYKWYKKALTESDIIVVWIDNKYQPSFDLLCMGHSGGHETMVIGISSSHPKFKELRNKFSIGSTQVAKMKKTFIEMVKHEVEEVQFIKNRDYLSDDEYDAQMAQIQNRLDEILIKGKTT